MSQCRRRLLFSSVLCHSQLHQGKVKVIFLPSGVQLPLQVGNLAPAVCRNSEIIAHGFWITVVSGGYYSLLSDCPHYLLDKWQTGQNAAARLMCKAEKSDHTLFFKLSIGF